MILVAGCQPNVLRPKEAKEVVVYLDTKLRSGYTYTAKVVTSRGVEATYTFVA